MWQFVAVVSSVTQFTKNQKLLYQRNKENNKLEWFSYWVSHSGTRTKIVSTKINFQLIKFYPWSYWFHTIRQRLLNPSFIVGGLVKYIEIKYWMRYRHQHLNTKSEAERFHTTGSHEPLTWVSNLGFPGLWNRCKDTSSRKSSARSEGESSRRFLLSLCDK